MERMKEMVGDYEIQKCSAAIRRGIENYRDYDYCTEFLDRLSDQAEELVGLLAPVCVDLERLEELVIAYVYSVCTGLEGTDGHRECILGPRPFEEVVDTAQELLWMSQSEYWCEGPVFKLAKRAG